MTSTPPKLVVHLDELEQVFAYLRTINKTPLQDIEWRRDNVPLVADQETIEKWKFVGLSNDYFPQMCMGWIKGHD